MSCPCGSKSEYNQCCGRFHSESEQPLTATELMKSRYSAYVKGEIDYIINTNHPTTRHQLSRQDIEDWASSSEWVGLEIVDVQAGAESDTKGVVEFKASYNTDGIKNTHHERSNFEKDQGQWFFVDGKVQRQSIRNEGPKIGRNDPCLCGSGKKYKKCCLK